MRNQLHYGIKRFFLIILVCFLIVTCTGQETQTNETPRTQADIQSGSTDCRFIQHQWGKACVPLHSQRLIVTDEITLDAVLALGVKPIAAAEQNIAGSRGQQFTGKLDGIISLGKESLINIERILHLKPDLILGLYFSRDQYQSFSQIAPTVKFDYNKYPVSDWWKYDLRDIAEVLGKTEQAQAALAHYQKRIQQLQEVTEEKSENLEVSVSRFYAGGANPPQFETIHSFAGGILQNAGFSAPLHQLQLTTSPDTLSVQISLERIDLLDADALFVLLDPGAEENFRAYYQSNPLWQTLNVVKNDRVYFVDSGYWWNGNILAANAILDDLFKYLIKENVR